MKEINEKSLLNNLKLPADLKNLSKDQLVQLCGELRSVMINTVSKNGGHLASNLGAVELTVAMHCCFNALSDRFVFDVGHQCYTHKLLTGRLDSFDTLRCEGGISGFPRPSESEYDAFSTGHSSTSVSAGFGISQAKALKNDNGYVVAVIGDGALSGGLAYEALNNAGRSHDNLIVVLNDNKMSISKNVGAMSRYLAVMRTRPKYHRLKMRTQKVMLKTPLIGKPFFKLLVRTKTALKGVFYKSSLFENMGFAYLGPVDGHNIQKLKDAFTIAKNSHRPVLLHVNTVKGKGYTPAEKGPNLFHGVSAFDIETGEPIAGNDSFSHQFGLALCDFAKNDRRVCAITAAMCESTGLEPFKKQFKPRFFDVGIAEQHAVTFSAGLSISGFIPFFAVYSTFLQRAYDQILHDAALQNLKVVLCIDRAGVVGDDGETHQGLFDVSFLGAMPNVTIYSPCTYRELRYDMKRAIYNDSGVIAIRYPRGGECVLPPELQVSESMSDMFGDSHADIAIVTYGREFGEVAKAYEQFCTENVGVRLIKLNRIKPIDRAAVECAAGAKRVYFFEEGMRAGGIGERFGMLLYESGFKGEYSLTAVDNFVPQAKVASSIAALKLDSDSIYNKIMEDCGDGNDKA